MLTSADCQQYISYVIFCGVYQNIYFVLTKPIKCYAVSAKGYKPR